MSQPQFVTSEHAPADSVETSEFRQIAESIDDYALFLLDPEGRVVTWNRGAEHIKGFAADEVLGQHVSRFYPQADVQSGKPWRELAQAAERGQVEDEGWRVRRDGSWFWANVVITTLRRPDGSIRGFAKLTRDMTEKRAAEQRRLEDELARVRAEVSERRMLAAQTVSDVAMGTLSLQAFLEHLLVGVRTLLSGDTATILLLDDDGRSLEVVASSGLEQEVRDRMRVPVGVGFAGGIAATRRPRVVEDVGTLEAVSPVLREHICSLMGAPLLTDDGLLGVIHVGTRDRRAFSADDVFLLDLVARRAAVALQRARWLDALEAREKSLREAVGMRDQFLSIASHELKTPLSALLLQAQALSGASRQGAAAWSPERVAKTAERIRFQVERLVSLVDQLLDVSRLTAGRLVLDLEPVSLAKVARAVIARFEDQAARTATPVTLRVHGAGTGQWDALRVDQVVTNLVSNALKYGTGRPVEVRVEATPEASRVTVSDQGIGIAPADQARIFERFERVVENRSFGGFGLGLWISRQLVGALGGTISVASEPGRGSTFTVELPAAGPERTRADPGAMP